MVRHLIADGAIEETRIEEAFRAVRRHAFLPDAPLDEVYRDAAVVTHRGPERMPVSSSSQPSMMARMLRQLDVHPGHRVLEIGAGTGYNAALLAQLAGPEGEVVTVDVDPEICARAEDHLRAAGVSNVSVVAADGWTVRVGGRPFDRIEATVGVWDLSTAWLEQLEAAGVIVAPLWLRGGLQASVAFKEEEGSLKSVSIEPCGFMRLRGAGAGGATYEQIGSWTGSFDEPNQERVALLRVLLQTEPTSVPAPPLSRGWFTLIALGEPDAVHLFSLGPAGATVAWGVLDLSAPGLAVVVSRVGSAATIETFGSDDAGRRLLRLIQSQEPVDLPDLTIEALPAAQMVQNTRPLGTLARPNFTFVVSRK